MHVILVADMAIRFHSRFEFGKLDMHLSHLDHIIYLLYIDIISVIYCLIIGCESITHMEI